MPQLCATFKSQILIGGLKIRKRFLTFVLLPSASFRKDNLLEYIMVICQASSSCRNSKISILWQHYIFRSHTQFKVFVIVWHAIVYEDRECVLVILNLGSHREWFVPEISETSSNLLSDSIILVIINLASIIGHGWDVGVVVFVVIIKGVKENTQTNPHVVATINWTLHALSCCVPKSQTISSNSTTTCEG